MTQFQPTIASLLNDGSHQRRTVGQLLAISDDAESQTLAFPLQRVRVRASIVGDCAVTTLEEHYANAHATALDVTHTLALPAGGAVTSFEIRAGERTIKGVCQKRDLARQTFDSAMARGKGAALVESARDDVHTISLANVPPRTGIVVTMTIVERLRVADGRFEYRFPTTISEKYIPGIGCGHDGLGTASDTDRAPDASHLTPPIRLEGGTELDLEITLPSHVSDLSGSIAFTRTDAEDGTARIRPTARATCNGDIVLRYWTRGSDAVVRAYTDGERTLVVIDPPAMRRPALETVRESIFVLDRSGSMQGKRLAAAKRALTRALGVLGERDLFHLIAFDTSNETFRQEPALATAKNRAAAAVWLSSIEARGGTDATPALQQSCCGPVASGRVRTVMLITDGAVGQDEEILALTRRFDPATRLFVVGIGVAPSDAFLARLARLGGGTHVLLDDNDNIEAEIERLDGALAGPIACGVHEVGARHAGRADLFAGRAATFFVEGAREQLSVTSVDGRFEGRCAVERAHIGLGALWARDEVMRLEDRLMERPMDRQLIESEIEQLGIAYQIQTRRTSFVGVDEVSQVHGDTMAMVQPCDQVRDLSVAHKSCASAPVVWRSRINDSFVHETGCFGAPAAGVRRQRLVNFMCSEPPTHESVAAFRSSMRSEPPTHESFAALRSKLTDPRKTPGGTKTVAPTSIVGAVLLAIALLAHQVPRKSRYWKVVMDFLAAPREPHDVLDALQATRWLTLDDQSEFLKFARTLALPHAIVEALPEVE